MRLPLLIVLLICSVTVVNSRSIEVNRNQLLRDLQILSSDDMEGRKVETAGSGKARAYIIERFIQSGIQPYGDSYEQPFTFSYREDKNKTLHRGTNIVGYIKGVHPDHTIVVTAHYDHLGIQKGLIYNGANDNASGVTALFATGSYFSKNQPRNSMIIAALDAEEESGAGGTKLAGELNKEQIVMNVNLDMIGRDQNNILFAAGTHHYSFLKPYLENVAANAPVKLRFGHDQPNLKNVEDWTKESDHYAFHLRGIPFIYFGVEDYEHHHKPTDDFENMTHDFFIDAVKTILMALKELDEKFSFSWLSHPKSHSNGEVNFYRAALH